MSKEEITDFRLTGREKDILEILWHSDSGMIASEIVKHSDDLTVNTVQAVLKKLLKRKLIKVDQIVYSGTVLSRSYVPTLSEEEFESRMLSLGIVGLERFSISPIQFIMGFLNDEVPNMTEEEADELIEMIQKCTEEKGK